MVAASASQDRRSSPVCPKDKMEAKGNKSVSKSKEKKKTGQHEKGDEAKSNNSLNLGCAEIESSENEIALDNSHCDRVPQELKEKRPLTVDNKQKVPNIGGDCDNACQRQLSVDNKQKLQTVGGDCENSCKKQLSVDNKQKPPTKKGDCDNDKQSQASVDNKEEQNTSSSKQGNVISAIRSSLLSRISQSSKSVNEIPKNVEAIDGDEKSEDKSENSRIQCGKGENATEKPSVESDSFSGNKFLSMPTFDSPDTGKSSHNDVAMNEAIEHQVDTQAVYENSIERAVHSIESRLNEENTDQCDYNEIIYTENQDFLELGSPGNTMDCDGPISASQQTFIPPSLQVIPKSSVASASFPSYMPATNVIDVHLTSPPQDVSCSSNRQNLASTTTNVPLNVFVGGVGSSTVVEQIPHSLSPQIIILPPQQTISSTNMMNFNLPTVSNTLQNLPKGNMDLRPQNVDDNSNSMTFVKEGFSMTDQSLQIFSKLNKQAKQTSNKLIAVPIGKMVRNKSLHVKSLDFGPCAGESSESEEKPAKEKKVAPSKEKWKPITAKPARSRGGNVKQPVKQNTGKQPSRSEKTKSDVSSAGAKSQRKQKVEMGTNPVRKTTKSNKTNLQEKATKRLVLQKVQNDRVQMVSSPDCEIVDDDLIPDKSGSIFTNKGEVMKVPSPKPEKLLSQFRKSSKPKKKTDVGIISNFIEYSNDDLPSPQRVTRDELRSPRTVPGEHKSFGVSSNIQVLRGDNKRQKPFNEGNITIPAPGYGLPLGKSLTSTAQGFSKYNSIQDSSDESDLDVGVEYEGVGPKEGVFCKEPMTVKEPASFKKSKDDTITDRTCRVEASPKASSNVDCSNRSAGNCSLLSIQSNYGNESEDSNSGSEDVNSGRPSTNMGKSLQFTNRTNTVSSLESSGASLGFQVCSQPKCSTSVSEQNDPRSVGSEHCNEGGPRSVETVSSSRGGSPWSVGSVSSPRACKNSNKSSFNIMMTPPKKRITATLKNGNGYYFFSSSLPEKSPDPVLPEKQECDSSISTVPRSPKTPKGKKIPYSDAVRRSPRLTGSPSKGTRSQATPTKGNVASRKRPREEPSEVRHILFNLWFTDVFCLNWVKLKMASL